MTIDVIRPFQAGIRSGPPWDSIVEFACHRSFCGKRLYPRQLTLLKLIYLETEQMTQYDLDVIESWRQGFKDRTAPHGVQPDVWDRVKYLKEHGYHHFPHVQFVGGRRGSKGIIGGLIGAERLAYFYSLGDWQRHYGLDPGTVGEVTVVATSQYQAARRLFADIRRTVEKCEYLKRHIIGNRYQEFSIRTPADEQVINDMKLAGVPVDREIATLYVNASSAISTAIRGGSTIMACLAPDTLILTADLRWVPIRSVLPGDEVIGVDENVEPGSGKTRKIRKATVLSRTTTHKKAYRLTFDDGRSVVCSGDHRWLFRSKGKCNSAKWRTICGISDYHSVRLGDTIFDFVDPWPVDDSREAGYLAGVYDGEGSLRNRSLAAAAGNCCGSEVNFSQKPGLVLSTVMRLMKEQGFVMKPCNSDAYRDRAVSRSAQQWAIRGIQQTLRFLGQIRPERLLANAHQVYEGSSLRGLGVRTIVSIEELPEQELIDISTTTRTFIANGLVSHNCYDEMAHLISGTGSSKTGDEIYSALQPSLDQFGKDKLTYADSSPYSQIGQFYELYKQGSVMMDVYNEREGCLQKGLDVNAEEELDILMADPEMLVMQCPSWSLYTDWEISHTIPLSPGSRRFFPKWKRPVQWPPEGDRPENKAMARMRLRNPDKFKVERGGQFATVLDAYLDEAKVDQMFAKPWFRAPLTEQDRGRVSIAYRAHADPSSTNANFAFAIAHIEWAPCDACGYDTNVNPNLYQMPNIHNCSQGGHILPHVIIDKLKVWKPENYPDHTVDYVQIGEELEGYLTKFPSIKTMSYDQWNSQGFIAAQKRKFPNIRVAEKTFTQKENQDRCEKFKSALNMGLIHSYPDTFGEEGRSLLELELKFLQQKPNGKVDRQEFGPVQTKDLSDATMVCVVDLLHDHLDRWYKNLNRMAVGSTTVAALKSGREFERLEAAGLLGSPSSHSSQRGVANRRRLEEMRQDRARGMRDRDRLPMRSRGRI